MEETSCREESIDRENRIIIKESYEEFLRKMIKAGIIDLHKITNIDSIKESYNIIKVYLNQYEELFIQIPSESLLRYIMTFFISGLDKLKNNSDIVFGSEIKGFMGPEYYLLSITNPEVDKKQVIFGIGAALYILSFKEYLLEYQYNRDNSVMAGEIIEQIKRRMTYVKSRKNIGQEFINFLCSLIQFDPDERPSLEYILRNKFLNLTKINHMVHDLIYDNDRGKKFLEFQKFEFLSKIHKKKIHKILFKQK